VDTTHGEPGAGRLARRVREGTLGKRPPETAAPRPRVYLTPWQQIVLLVAGDKAGDWRGWYRKAIPRAEQLYAEHIEAMSARGAGDR
jgi:hypothetical protein